MIILNTFLLRDMKHDITIYYLLTLPVACLLPVVLTLPV